MLENFSQRQKNATGSINNEKHSDTYSSQDYVNAPRKDTRANTDAPIGKDDTSNACHPSSTSHNIDWNVSTDINKPIDQKDEPPRNEILSGGDKLNLRPNHNPNFTGSNRY